MKRNILLFIFILFCVKNISSQENISTPQKYYAYCVLSSGWLDFGASEKFWMEKEPDLQKKKGKLISFRSVADALNYMCALGWEIVQTYSTGGSIDNLSTGDSDMTFNSSRVLRKEVTKEELEQINAMIREKF